MTRRTVVAAGELAVLASLALVALNLLTTGRWASVAGAARGWRWPYIAAAIIVAAMTTILGLKRRVWGVGPATKDWYDGRWAPLPWAIAAAGIGVLTWLLFVDWFPPSSWRWIPFLDDWPPRYSSTVEGVALLRRGAFVGWQWNLLGGYSSATDITQSLTLLGAIPMLVFGDRVGFHLLHVAMYLSVPALVYADLARGGDRRVGAMAAGLSALGAAGLALARSGDTNSLAGIVSTLGVLTASHYARSNGRLGLTSLIATLSITAYSHLGFFIYAAGLVLIEAVYYRDAAHARRGCAAGMAAAVISLPLTFELFWYPAEFNFNNVIYYGDAPLDWTHAARTIGYNAQILLSPWRWFGNLAFMFAPVVLLAVKRRDGRAGFYAWATVFLVVLGLFNVPQVGYFFARQGYLLAVVATIPVGWFLVTECRTTLQAVSLASGVALLIPIVRSPIPHQPSVAAFAPAVVARIQSLDGHMILLENNPHRDVDAAPERLSAPSLLGTHYESLVPTATGRRLYAGYWDGWQWTPFRGEMLAGGAWQGHTLEVEDHDRFLEELRRWGIRHLLVWSEPAKHALGAWPELASEWRDGPWTQFVLQDWPADTRSVTTSHGTGVLAATDPLGGRVQLVDVEAGDEVVVRTHYHPAWQVWVGGTRVTPYDVDGQLAFRAPDAGSYDVRLVYPARRWLLGLAAGVLVAALVLDRRRVRRVSRLRSGG